MLHYMGTRQAPRKYPVPEAHLATSIATELCDVCTKRAWTPKTFSTLLDAPFEQDSVTITYVVTSEELRTSVLNGCRFCRTLADGIHGRMFLDEMYQRWNKTDSWPESVNSGDSKSPEYGDEAIEQEQEEDGNDWNDASAFNEEKIADDVTGGWEAWEDRDTLFEASTFEVRLSFEREVEDCARKG
ncbi:uncharacterized protein K460DRAFT_83823 [Cucurbitaria berberidis CBS 394.84]|uniref:Uncharacterized protein n=1 Tax=Cucurbitaria berberidis CBS 394.84 TaxID=1168544 RepID=A0A9P4GPE7_9PLEO|nr:uncharacterized protein K460DRAFT_83823 [Cucurbitaria berberidis CBS 394.84]KAF1848986.1 hypothetical protein K460DRAFT_83823 [Cucurbitaria berberidis CBS 394.84]